MSANLASLSQWRGAAGSFGKTPAERWHIVIDTRQVKSYQPAAMPQVPINFMPLESIGGARLREEMTKLGAVCVRDPIFGSETNDCAPGSILLLLAQKPSLIPGMCDCLVKCIKEHCPSLANGVMLHAVKIFEAMSSPGAITDVSTLTSLRALMCIASTALPQPATDPWHVPPADVAQVVVPYTTVPVGAVAALLRACGVRAAILTEYKDSIVDRCDAGDADSPFLGALLVRDHHMCAVICEGAAPALVVPKPVIVPPTSPPSGVIVVLANGAQGCMPLDVPLNLLSWLYGLSAYGLGVDEQRFVLDGQLLGNTPCSATLQQHGASAGSVLMLFPYMRVGGAGASTATHVNVAPISPETLAWQNPEEIFDKLDADGTGTLERSELVKGITGAGYTEEHALAILGELDADKDGTVTRQEWRKGFFASSLVSVKHPADETFDDLHHGCPGCSIPETEYRAINLPQLQDVGKHIERRCPKEGWVNFESAALSAKSVTLYDAARYVIKPATYARQCAFVELVAEDAQRPKWFTSHWWGEPVLDFVACVTTHAVDHGSGNQANGTWQFDATAYWVCAYANNQHDLASVNAPTLEETSFYKALKLAEGTVSILDRDGMCFKRVWCSYECFITLTQTEGKYEVYTALEHESKDFNGDVHARSAIGIVDGLGVQVCDNTVTEDTEDKALREAHFPLALATQAFTLQLETATASVENDRIKILNTIAVKENLAATPPATHPRYDALNATVRGRLAIVALRGLLQAGEPIEEAVTLLKGCGRRKLELGFNDVKAFDANAMQLIAQNLPPTLEELIMERAGLKAEHAPALASALPALTKLSALKCAPPL